MHSFENTIVLQHLRDVYFYDTTLRVAYEQDDWDEDMVYDESGGKLEFTEQDNGGR